MMSGTPEAEQCSVTAALVALSAPSQDQSLHCCYGKGCNGIKGEKPSKKAVWSPCFSTRLPLLSSARGPGWDVGVFIPPGGSGGTVMVTQPHSRRSVTVTFLVPSCDSCLPHPGPIPRE